MPIKFNCQECGKKLGVAEHLAGRRGKCPQCGRIFVVPAAGAVAPPPPRVMRQDPTDYEVRIEDEQAATTAQDVVAVRGGRGLRRQPARTSSASKTSVGRIVVSMLLFGLAVSIGVAVVGRRDGSGPTTTAHEDPENTSPPPPGLKLRVWVYWNGGTSGDALGMQNDGDGDVEVMKIVLNEEFARQCDILLQPRMPQLRPYDKVERSCHSLSLFGFRNAQGVPFGPVNVQGIQKIAVVTDHGTWTGVLSTEPQRTETQDGHQTGHQTDWAKERSKGVK